MSKIKQLPSGNYNTLIYDYTDPNGKRHYKSITAPSKKEVKLLVAEFQSKKGESHAESNMTVREALKHYIAVKSNVLSPSTVKGYDVILRNRVPDIMDIPISKLTLSDIQSAINKEAENHKPKTVSNTNACIEAAIKLSVPGFNYSVTLPQKEKNEIEIPTEEEVRKLFEAAKGKRIETALYLAAVCGMRRSEIAALKWENVDLKKGAIDIIAAEVIDIDNKKVRKAPKKTSSYRRIKIFKPALDHLKSLPQTSEKVTKYISPSDITEEFSKLETQANIPHYRFHDLRHYAASVMLMLNIPQKYVSSFLGHSSERMVENVYGHIMRDKKDTFMDNVNTYFCSFFDQMQDKMQDEK